MTIEQVKEEAKKRFNKDLTDEQAQTWLEAHPAGELQDEELSDVAGGGCGSSGNEVTIHIEKNPAQMGPCPRCGCNEHKRIDFGIPVSPERLNFVCAGCGMKFFVYTRKWVG